LRSRATTMPLTRLLFSPNGRIGPRDFLRGIIILLAVVIVNQVLSVYGGVFFAPVSLVVTVGIIYGYLCVFGKRLHDRGMSAWFFLLLLVAYVIMDAIFQAILTPFLAPEALALQEGLADMVSRGRWEDATVFMQDLAREVLFSALLSVIAINGILGFAMSRLRSDPGMNQYGPPPPSAGNPFD